MFSTWMEVRLHILRMTAYALRIGWFRVVCSRQVIEAVRAEQSEPSGQSAEKRPKPLIASVNWRLSPEKSSGCARQGFFRALRGVESVTMFGFPPADKVCVDSVGDWPNTHF